MGKTTGFMEYKRVEQPERQLGKRVKDWKEFKKNITRPEIQKQGARCMECGIPYCHPGIELNNGVSGCPLNNLIPEWNDLIYRRRNREALERLLVTNNFPEFTGRVCPAPCEGSCTVGLNKSPVAIKAIEKYIIEQSFQNRWITPRPPAARTNKHAAVIGSGPAGLAAADCLNRAGHRVTVFEKEDRPGGLLMYGIPNMKLDKQKVLNRRINIMKKEGIIFKTGIYVGRDMKVTELQNKFEAILLCGGAEKPRDLNIPGRNLDQIFFAVDYLKASTKAILGERKQNSQINAAGKNVLIIGGGDTGTDCVASAIRQDCKSITQFEILPEPPQERQKDNPWPEWPRILNKDYGHREAEAVFGSDPRNFNIKTVKFTGDDTGSVNQVHTVQVKWEENGKGNYEPREIKGSEKKWKIDMVIIAVGFLGPNDLLIKRLNLKQSSDSSVWTDKSFRTNQEAVFAAGDMRRGQSLVVHAIDEGRKMSYEVDKFLKKKF